MIIKISSDPTIPQPTVEMLAEKGWRAYQYMTEMYVEVPDDITQQNVLDEIAAFDPIPGCIIVAHDTIDKSSGEARARYITVAPGQDAVYALKKEQAEAYKAAGYPADTTSYPLIQAEATASTSTPTVACDFILTKAGQWVQLAAVIEQIRQSAKQQVSAVTDATQWQTINQIVRDAVAQLDQV